MRRSLIIVVMLLSLTACTGQQVQDVAGWTAGAAILAAAAVSEYKNDDDTRRDNTYRGVPVDGNPIYRHYTHPCQICVEHREEQRQDARLEAAEEYRTAQRIAELNAALDEYRTVDREAGVDQRSVVFVPADPAVPQQSVERLDAVVPEAVSED